MLENNLEINDVHAYVLFENHDPEFKLYSLINSVYGTSFGKISITKWKHIMFIVTITVYKNTVFYVL